MTLAKRRKSSSGDADDDGARVRNNHNNECDRQCPSRAVRRPLGVAFPGDDFNLDGN